MPKHPTHRPSLFMGLLAFAVAAVLAGAFAPTAGAFSDRVNISRMGGDIDLADVPDGGSLKTMGGNVHVGKAHNDISITTMGGDISVDSADGPVKATTMGGNISVGSANASVEAKTMGGNVEATLVQDQSSAAHDITLTSMGGEIVLTVPRDYPMTIDVELAYTKRNDGRYKITESLGLNETASQEWDYSHGSARKYLYARGKIGNGRNHVTIKTINGNIIIKGERSQL